MNTATPPPNEAPAPPSGATEPSVPVELLLVDASETDGELCIRALRKNNLANAITWVRDGEEALDFLFARGKFAGRSVEHPPKVVLLDLRLPRVGGLEVLRQVR